MGKTMTARFSALKRQRVYEKTNGHCAYCGVHLDPAQAHIDHVKPQCDGGSNDISNLLPSCNLCNLAKGAKSLEDFRIVRTARVAGIPGFFGLPHIHFLRRKGLMRDLGIDIHHKFFFEQVM